jgi:ADP-ribosyl-[dinitrogen reductase] hydrolase
MATGSVSAASCKACARLPPEEPPAIRWPVPMAADEWARDERIRGALLGLAVGDALGSLARAGASSPVDPSPGSLRTGGATQLALFTAEGVLRMHVRLAAKGIGPAWGVMRHALDRWMVTQGRQPNTTFAWQPEAWPDGWLVRQHRLHQRVDGFGATVEALRVQADTWEGMPERHVATSLPNTSNGAGAVVRVLGAGLVAQPKDAMLLGSIAGAITHGGADGYLAAGALARLVSELVAGTPIEDAIAAASADLSTWPGSGPVRTALSGSASAGGSSATRAIAIAMSYASFGAPDEPVTTIGRAIAAGGTSAGVVAGAVAGARLGASAFPAGWLMATDVADVVEEIARASSAAHRAWVMERELPGYAYEPDEPFAEDPTCALFWPRFPGW